MERQQILDVVIKNIKLNVDGLDDVAIESSKSMKDYGASSLDIVEIVNSTLRELRVKVARTELANLKDIDEFVDLLSRIKQEQ